MTRRSRATRSDVPVGDRDHTQGPATAPATLMEYGDFECPYCGEAYSIVKDIQRRLGSRLRFVFRHFPLATIHPHAEYAAEAAEAAGAQGKFWEMHDVLYENQEALDVVYLVRYATALDLDTSRFIDDLDRHTHAARVREDFLSGARGGVNGTPTFFINGVRHDGSYDFDTLLGALEGAIGRQNGVD
ncbi:DsbA family protein [Paludisphaera borealis]|uniref:Disulfide bond formation protein D n=1 Tax=Paludisphaera borealis TaxID=1387353 RepID=A0A1U7CWZ0_9BACT|nr:DsbA family protein [Paludisphaera borealis]APW63470.1 Disulfide bond formation protein D [Paludisphaera borealis]